MVFRVTMEDGVALEHISTIAKCDLRRLCLGDLSEDESIESPFIQNNNNRLFFINVVKLHHYCLTIVNYQFSV